MLRSPEEIKKRREIREGRRIFCPLCGHAMMNVTSPETWFCGEDGIFVLTVKDGLFSYIAAL